MKHFNLRVLLIAAMVTGSYLSYSQKLKKADKAVIKDIQSHITFLADDKLEGRRSRVRPAPHSG